MKLEIIKKKSYDLLNTIQRNHLKVQISTIDPLLIQKSKSSFSNLIRDGPVNFLSWHRDTAQIITHPLYYYSAVWLWILTKDPILRNLSFPSKRSHHMNILKQLLKIWNQSENFCFFYLFVALLLEIKSQKLQIIKNLMPTINIWRK